MSAGIATRGSLYILFGALLMGTLWSGGYFPVPKWALLSALLAATVWELTIRWSQGERPHMRSPAMLMLGAFTVFAAASCLWSVSPADSLREALLLFSYLGVLIVVRSQLDRNADNARAIAMWLVYVAAFVSAWGIVTYIYRLTPYTIFLDNLYRAGSTFEYSNGLGCFVLMALPVASVLMGKVERGDRPLYAAAQAMMVAAAVLTFSRLGMALLVVVALYMVASQWRRGLALASLASIVAGVVAAALAVVLSDKGQEPAAVAMVVTAVIAVWLAARFLPQLRGLKQVTAFGALALAGAATATFIVTLSDRAKSILEQRVQQGFTPGRLLPHRLETFEGAVDAFRVRPVGGSGLGTFAEVYQQYTIATYTKFAHNLVLQTAVETGLVGALLLFAFLIYILGLCAMRLLGRSDALTRAFALALLVFLIYNMVDWEWYIPSLTGWFMVSLAVAEAGTGGKTGDEARG